MSIFDNFRRQSQRRLSPLQPVGFHGDKNLMSLVDNIMQSVHVFIETGTNVGSTITYVARTYPTTRCFSCEPDLRAYTEAVKNSRDLAGVSIYNETSKTFMERLEQEHDYLFEEKILFWLDAHGYGFKWPLREEVNFITTKFSSAYILIDDFKVPGLDCFGFDSYKDQESSFEYLRTALSSKQEYAIYYPAYTEKTSTFHPLRGWGLIVLGPQNDIGILESMGDKIQRDKSAS
jgi:hypothetical protein